MHFTTVLATSIAITGALAGQYYEAPAPEPVPEYPTTTTSCSKTVVPDYEPTESPEPVYPTEPAYPSDSPEEPEYPCSDVVYTSYSTYVKDYAHHTTAYYSTSKCPVAEPTYVPSYPAKNCTTSDVPAPYPTPVPTYPPHEEPEYPSEEPETYTKTYYTTVCPGKSYCYATTVTSTYCPSKETSYAPEPPKHYPTPEPEKPSYVPVPPPTYTKPAYPPHNETVPAPPPSYTGAASSTAVSFGAVAFAGLVALFVAA